DFIAALGGATNIVDVAACTTRLRLVMADNTAIDEAALRRLGARGVLRSAGGGLQVVLGPMADQVAGEIRADLRSRGSSPLPAPPAGAAPGPAAASVADAARALLAALGGPANVRTVETAAGRLLVTAISFDSLDKSALSLLGIRGVAQVR